MNSRVHSTTNYDRPKRAPFIKKRLLIVIMTTLCPVVCYISRQNLSMAIVAMVDDSAPADSAQGALAEHALRNATHAAHLHHGRAAANSTTSGLPASARGALSKAIRRLEEGACPTDGPDGSFLGAPATPKSTNSNNHTKQGEHSKSYGPQYAWSGSDKSLVLESFYYTYVAFQIPAARLAERMGGKWVLAIATIGSSIISLLSPWAASMHVCVFATLRAIMGACQTAVFPACYVIYAHWLPPFERSQALPLLVVGVYVGSIVAFLTAGFFSEQAAFGWPWAFYVPSGVCALWSVLWIQVGASTPRQHQSISLEELEYIESQIDISRYVAHMQSTNSSSPVSSSPTPTENSENWQTERTTRGCMKKNVSWRKILTSQHVWALNSAMFASNWSFSIVMLLLPLYLNDIQHIPPLKNGMIISVIYTLFCIMSPLVGSGSTMMVETRAFGLSRLNTRKLFESICLFGQAACFVALPIIGCARETVLGVLFLQIILFSFNNGGEVQLPTELSINFAGTIYAIGNCIGSATGFIVPRVHSWIVTNRFNRFQWEVYFYVAASVTALGGVVFILFGRNDLQDFSSDDLCESQEDIVKSTNNKTNSNLTLTNVKCFQKQ